MLKMLYIAIGISVVLIIILLVWYFYSSSDEDQSYKYDWSSVNVGPAPLPPINLPPDPPITPAMPPVNSSLPPPPPGERRSDPQYFCQLHYYYDFDQKKCVPKKELELKCAEGWQREGKYCMRYVPHPKTITYKDRAFGCPKNHRVRQYEKGYAYCIPNPTVCVIDSDGNQSGNCKKSCPPGWLLEDGTCRYTGWKKEDTIDGHPFKCDGNYLIYNNGGKLVCMSGADQHALLENPAYVPKSTRCYTGWEYDNVTQSCKWKGFTRTMTIGGKEFTCSSGRHVQPRGKAPYKYATCTEDYPKSASKDTCPPKWMMDKYGNCVWDDQAEDNASQKVSTDIGGLTFTCPSDYYLEYKPGSLFCMKNDKSSRKCPPNWELRDSSFSSLAKKCVPTAAAKAQAIVYTPSVKMNNAKRTELDPGTVLSHISYYINDKLFKCPTQVYGKAGETNTCTKSPKYKVQGCPTGWEATYANPRCRKIEPAVNVHMAKIVQEDNMNRAKIYNKMFDCRKVGSNYKINWEYNGYPVCKNLHKDQPKCPTGWRMTQEGCVKTT